MHKATKTEKNMSLLEKKRILEGYVKKYSDLNYVCKKAFENVCRSIK